MFCAATSLRMCKTHQQVSAHGYLYPPKALPDIRATASVLWQVPVPLTAGNTIVDCRDKEAAVKLLSKSFDRVYARSMDKFQTGRWTKMTPPLKKLGGGFLLGTSLSDAFIGIEVDKRTAGEYMQNYGKRLSKLRSRMRQPTFKFGVACCLERTQYLDTIRSVF